MAAVDVEVHTTIDRPRREVAAYCCDPGNVTAWNANIQTVQWETEREIATRRAVAVHQRLPRTAGWSTPTRWRS